MSKSFELLNELGLARDLFPADRLCDAGAEFTKPNFETDKFSSSYSEAINLVQRVFLAKPELAPHAVVFTSAGRGAGCSWVCARSSEALADRVPNSVCIVDANLRTPSIHRCFQLSNHRGLSDALLQDNSISDYVQKTRDGKLSVLTAGATVGASSPWDTDRVRERIAELRDSFAFVLIDSPAVNVYTDVAVLSSVVNGAILVIDAEATRREVALQAKDVLAAAKLPFLGTVLNRRSFPIPEFIYRRL
jgi:capsular exopolysaccharide synthesis family protein